MGVIATDGRDFFSEEKRHTSHQLAFLDKGVPGFRLVNTCEKGRYEITPERKKASWRLPEKWTCRLLAGPLFWLSDLANRR
jgi:hypothetical protein